MLERGYKYVTESAVKNKENQLYVQNKVSLFQEGYIYEPII